MNAKKVYEVKGKKSDLDQKIDDLTGPDILNPDDKPWAKPEEPKSKSDKIDLKKASQQDTLRATAGITPTERMTDLLSRMRNIDDTEDDGGYPEPEPTREVSVEVNTENLPAVVSKALRAEGSVVPTFHQVANLPGNMSRGIRQMGKQLFRMFTTTPTDEIYMIGNLGGMGPNSAREVNAVAGYLRDHGVDLDIGDIDFEDIIPGYHADIYQYSANGVRWLLVLDDFGQYIYTWPENTSVQHRNLRQLGSERE
jgi:hypothetical protein